MSEARADETGLWLRKAEDDLRAARVLGSGTPPLRGIAVYHCQQAAEKALKGLLVAFEVRFAKTHDVRALLEMAVAIEPTFASWKGAAIRLTPFAYLYRYPGPGEEPDEETMREAIDDADAIVDRVNSFLGRQTTEGQGATP